MSNLKGEWALIQKAFPILKDVYSMPFKNEVSKDEFYKCIEVIDKLKLSKTIQSLILKRVEKFARETITPQFWALFQFSSDPYEGFRNFYKAVELLYEYYIQFLTIISNLEIMRKSTNFKECVYGESNLKDALKLILRAALLSQFPTDRNENIHNFYKIALRMEDNQDQNHGEKFCQACLFENEKCTCAQYFYETNRKLLELGLVEPLVSQVLTSLVYLYIEHHIENTCKDSFDTSHLDGLEMWMDSVMLNWIKKIYSSDVSSLTSDCVVAFDKKLRHYMYETYCKVRINQLFNIIIEYPESLPALEDLRICLPRTDLKGYLTKKMQQSMETRLLHPGVSTPDILTAYIAAIRSMKVLDPSGLLYSVTQPVHQYLRSREDTIRCVVSSLTEDGPNDLAEELVRGEGIQTDENNTTEDDGENWENWTPDPVDVDPVKNPSCRRISDIISMLVNVYGSKDLFVNEYRTLLADRLLSQLSCQTEKEIRYLELLKLRFGDSQLHYCEVMLKDVADSKRINQNIKQESDYVEDDDFSMSAMILSAQFWPAFKEEKLQLPEVVQDQMEEYTRAFETLKGSRTLCWKTHLGLVDLEIELLDRTLNLSVSPVHATIILHFQDKCKWQLDELSRVMQVPPSVLRRKINLWQVHGLINETSTDMFELVEEREDKNSTQPAENFEEDFESESAMASAQDQREEELQTFWSYIVGMLLNLDTLPLERIHQMLKMFAFQGPTQEHSLPELKQFLDRKVREHKLVFSGGLYRLPV